MFTRLLSKLTSIAFVGFCCYLGWVLFNGIVIDGLLSKSEYHYDWSYSGSIETVTNQITGKAKRFDGRQWIDVSQWHHLKKRHSVQIPDPESAGILLGGAALEDGRPLFPDSLIAVLSNRSNWTVTSVVVRVEYGEGESAVGEFYVYAANFLSRPADRMQSSVSSFAVRLNKPNLLFPNVNQLNIANYSLKNWALVSASGFQE